jgi:betaine-aldehyde dehydrogenase
MRPIVNPADGSAITHVPDQTPEDVERAVSQAAKALGSWSTAAPVERSSAILNLAQRMQERAAEYAEVETSQTGKPLRLSAEFDVPGSIDNAMFFSGAARNLEGKAAAEWDGSHTSMIRREAIGVVGSIAPWNYPLQMAMWKILPAIAAGNTVVLKPAEVTPLTALMVAQDAQAAGIPDGVISVVTGEGPVVGEALVTHPGVAMVSFTGSTAVGKRVGQLAVRDVKRVHLELGGKAPFVVFDDADLEAAIHGAAAGSLINTGQDCTAATRVYVQRPLYDAFISGVTELFSAIRIGDPMDPDTDIGPLVSVAQQQRVAKFVEEARRDGARILTGGEIPGGDLAQGAYYRPTIIVDAAQESAIVQQEIFGPVLVVLPFDSDEEALTLANDTPYGLAASAWTSDVFRALRATREIRAGCVWINDHIPIVSEMPHGGYKASGFGKDMSSYSFDEYTQIKHVSMDITGIARKEWHRTIFQDRTSTAEGAS